MNVTIHTSAFLYTNLIPIHYPTDFDRFSVSRARFPLTSSKKWVHTIRCNNSSPHLSHSKPKSNNSLEFERNNGIFYLAPNVLSKKDFSLALELSKGFHNKAKPKPKSFALNRLYYNVPPSNPLQDLLCRSKQVIDRIEAIVQKDLVYVDDSLQFRVYPIGSGMEWHIDDLLYTEPQYELIFTVLNESDCLTEWIDVDDTRHSKWTEPNSLLIVKAQGAKHRVTIVKRGTRTILKYRLASTTSTLLDSRKKKANEKESKQVKARQKP